MSGESLWSRLAGLALVVEGCEYDRLHAMLAYEFERVTTEVRLVGAGTDGVGEDVSDFREDGTTLHETRPSLPLEGEWTLASFCDHPAALELWPEPRDGRRSSPATVSRRSSCGRSLRRGPDRGAIAT